MDDARYRALAHASDARLERLLQSSRGPAPESLVGFEWRGYNTPWTTTLLGIRTFIKGFYQGRHGVEGYNVRVRQNGLDGPWTYRPGPAGPTRYAYYTVVTPDPAGRDSAYPQALLLDYGASEHNARYRIERLLRDYVVQPDPTDPDLLLGKAYVALGALRVCVGYFVLQRLQPVDATP